MSSRKQKRLKQHLTVIEDEVNHLAQTLKDTKKSLLKQTRELKMLSESFGDQVDIGIPAEVHIVTYNYQDKEEKREESVIAGVFSDFKKAKEFIKNELSVELTENFESYYDQRLATFAWGDFDDKLEPIKARAMTSKSNKVFIKLEKYAVE